MPREQRKPIDYTPQFGGGMFRPKEVVESELAAVESERVGSNTEPSGSTGRKKRTDERTNVRPNQRPATRIRVRHSFDIWQDQLLSLTEIQASSFGKTGRKPKVGELVQEALDAYIAKHNDRTNVATNVRTNAREETGV